MPDDIFEPGARVFIFDEDAAVEVTVTTQGTVVEINDWTGLFLGAPVDTSDWLLFV